MENDPTSSDDSIDATSTFRPTVPNSKPENTLLYEALHHHVGSIVRLEEQEEDEEEEPTVPRMSREAIGTLTKMTYYYATKCLGPDLVRFGTHAGRKTVTVDDVKLVARKNPRGLLDSLERFCESSTVGGDGGGVVGAARRMKSSVNAHNRNIAGGLGGLGGNKKRKRGVKGRNQQQDTVSSSEDMDGMGLTQQRDHLWKQAESSSDESDALQGANKNDIQFRVQVDSSTTSSSGEESSAGASDVVSKTTSKVKDYNKSSDRARIEKFGKDLSSSSDDSMGWVAKKFKSKRKERRKLGVDSSSSSDERRPISSRKSIPKPKKRMESTSSSDDSEYRGKTMSKRQQKKNTKIRASNVTNTTRDLDNSKNSNKSTQNTKGNKKPRKLTSIGENDKASYSSSSSDESTIEFSLGWNQNHTMQKPASATTSASGSTPTMAIDLADDED